MKLKTFFFLQNTNIYNIISYGRPITATRTFYKGTVVLNRDFFVYCSYLKFIGFFIFDLLYYHKFLLNFYTQIWRYNLILNILTFVISFKSYGSWLFPCLAPDYLLGIFTLFDNVKLIKIRCLFESAKIIWPE
jgi:hypothetical protein